MPRLTLTRKQAQRILIECGAERIWIEVALIERKPRYRDQVRLAITAPAHVRVDREEVAISRGAAPFEEPPHAS